MGGGLHRAVNGHFVSPPIFSPLTSCAAHHSAKRGSVERNLQRISRLTVNEDCNETRTNPQAQAFETTISHFQFADTEASQIKVLHIEADGVKFVAVFIRPDYLDGVILAVESLVVESLVEKRVDM